MKISAAVAVSERSQKQHSGQVIRQSVKGQFPFAYLHRRRGKSACRRNGKITPRIDVNLRSHGRCPELICHCFKVSTVRIARNADNNSIEGQTSLSRFLSTALDSMKTSPSRIPRGRPRKRKSSDRQTPQTTHRNHNQPRQSRVVYENMYFRLSPRRFFV